MIRHEDYDENDECDTIIMVMMVIHEYDGNHDVDEADTVKSVMPL